MIPVKAIDYSGAIRFITGKDKNEGSPSSPQSIPRVTVKNDILYHTCEIMRLPFGEKWCQVQFRP